MLFGRISFRGEASGPAKKEKERKEKKGKRIRLKSRRFFLSNYFPEPPNRRDNENKKLQTKVSFADIR